MPGKLSEEQRAEIVRRYAAGEDAPSIARGVNCGSTTVYRVLESNGCARRSLQKVSDDDWADIERQYAAGQSSGTIADQFGISRHVVWAHLRQSNLARSVQEASAVRAGGLAWDIHGISADRWKELYWGPNSGYPAVIQLARLLGCSDTTVRRHLAKAGLRIRTHAEQSMVEFRQARHPRPSDFPSQARAASRIIAKQRGPSAVKRMHTLEARRRGAMARHRRISRACEWCGVLVENRQSQALRTQWTACSQQHRALANAHRRFRLEAPRPVIVPRLRDLMVLPNGIPIAHPTREQLEKAAAQIGAREPEIEAVLLESMR